MFMRGLLKGVPNLGDTTDNTTYVPPKIIIPNIQWAEPDYSVAINTGTAEDWGGGFKQTFISDSPTQTSTGSFAIAPEITGQTTSEPVSGTNLVFSGVPTITDEQMEEIQSIMEAEADSATPTNVTTSGSTPVYGSADPVSVSGNNVTYIPAVNTIGKRAPTAAERAAQVTPQNVTAAAKKVVSPENVEAVVKRLALSFILAKVSGVL